MGQKVNPIGFRLGINRTWDSRWYDDRDYAKLLAEDLKILNVMWDCGTEKILEAKRYKYVVRTQGNVDVLTQATLAAASWARASMSGL